MQINKFALISSSVLLTSTLALAGGAEQVTLRLDTVQAKPGELVSVSISMETTELVGGFGFTLSAEGNDVTYDMKPDRNDPTAVGTQEMAEAICAKMR